MGNLADEPLFTETFSRIDEFVPDSKSAYIFADNGEFRSQHISRWKTNSSDVEFVEISSQTWSSFSAHGREVMTRKAGDLNEFVRTLRATVIYLDITGLLHAVWAPLLKALVESGREVRSTYVEPDGYKRHSAPVDGHIYDLSKEIRGIAPLPGYTVLRQRNADDFLFVPLLGFEGTRFRYLLEQVQPSNDRIRPIIGVPGFKPWYVFETYAGNAPALRESGSWVHARYAPANCPFSCFYTLRQLAAENPDFSLKIAPIGTKPHALGAIMFALSRSAPIEIVYDNPVRQSGRTAGTSRLFVYYVSSVLPPTRAAMLTH